MRGKGIDCRPAWTRTGTLVMPAASGGSSARAELPVLDGDYVRDEHEQVTYLRELTEIFEAEGMDFAEVG